MLVKKTASCAENKFKTNIRLIKHTVNLDIISIIQLKREVLHIIAYEIENLVYLIKFLKVFIMDQTINILLSQNSYQMSLTNNSTVLEKVRKNT